MTKPIQPVTAKKRLDVVSVVQNIRNRIVYRVRTVILAIQIVVHANVTSTAPKVTSVNHPTVNVHANRTLLVISANDVQKVTTVQSVYLVIAMTSVH